MKKDVNFIFFGLLILLLTAMVGTMLYSDYTYHKVNAQYLEFKNMFEQAQDQLNQTKSEIEAKDLELQEKENSLIEIINELNLSKQKETSLEGYYTTVKTEKEGLQDQLSDTVEDRDKWRTDYLTTKQELGICEKDSDLLEMNLNNEKNKVIECKKSVAGLKTYVENITSKLEETMTALEDLDCGELTCEGEKDELEELIQELQTIIIKFEEEADKIKT
ncbi:MAG: hypothetical protein JW778_06890 [Candidatus Altiarchaeota archaeon]|nr:hypothetical protein [Candidatus Altiarchaeota archaeon]